MRWARHYKKRKSSAFPIIIRIRRQEEMVRRTDNKQSVARAAAKKKLVNAPPEKQFFLHDGTGVKNIEELAMMMDKMSDDDFRSFVNDEKNDFSNWISEVFGQKELADSILHITDKKESQRLLLKHSLSGKK